MQSLKLTFRQSKTWVQRGFTLIELLVVIAIVAILATLAAPSFQGLIANQALDGHTSTLAEDLRLARSVALRRGRSVTICASNNSMAVTPTCIAAASATWSTGWIIFEDADVSNTFNAGDVLVRRQETLDRAGQFNEGTGNSTSPTTMAPEYFRYGADGRIAGGASGAGSIVLKASNADDNLSRAVCVNSTGRVRGTVKPATTCPSS